MLDSMLSAKGETFIIFSLNIFCIIVSTCIQSATCKTRPNILPDLALCLVVHVENNQRTCASLCYLSKIDIFQCITPHVNFQQSDWSIGRVTILNVTLQCPMALKFAVE